MKTALLSVWDKTEIADFARELKELNFNIIASKGTARVLAKAEIPVQDIASIVGGGPILGHRVVTLSREIHAGLLAKETPEDLEELKRLGIPKIDLVCVDLYPLEAEINRSGATRESVIEKTDIGGPTLLRSAAKGGLIVICDPQDRQRVIDWLKAGQPKKEDFLTQLAAKAEATAANYSLASAHYHSGGNYDGFIGEQVQPCRYGENPWQIPTGLFGFGSSDPLSLDRFELVEGATPSFMNLCDHDRMLQTITHIAAVFDVNRSQIPLIAVGAKHGNPCGAAIGNDSIEVLQKMVSGDPQAIFGGLIITNFSLDEAGAKVLRTHLVPKGGRPRILDGIITPSIYEGIIKILKRPKGKCRFLVNPNLLNLNSDGLDSNLRFRQVRGGFLRQPNYTFILNLNDLSLEKLGQATPDQERDLLLAWAIGSTSNSNTITLVKDGYLIGNGVSQPSRVGACKLAVWRAKEAGHETAGAVASSDSFFPFKDGPAVLAEAGIKVILASSGSIMDEEVKKFCQEKGVILYLIPDQIGRGFFGH